MSQETKMAQQDAPETVVPAGDEAEAVDWGATAQQVTNAPPTAGNEPGMSREDAGVIAVTNNYAQGNLGVTGSDDLSIAEDGVVMFKNRIVGEFDGSTLTLNAGWARLAGLGIKIEGDTTDRRRVVFERASLDHHLSSRA